MKVSTNILNRLYESLTDDEINSISDNLINQFYDKSKGDFNRNIDQEISKLVNNQEDIYKVKQDIEKKIKELDTKEVEEKSKSEEMTDEQKEIANKIAEALSDYNISVEPTGVKPGPSVTLYKFKYARGIVINDIINRSKEIASVIPVESVMIAPISSEVRTVGIQVPNKERANVSLDSVMENSEKSGVSVALGIDLDGNAVSADILKMQHVLIGGTTGSGKSACINSMICSLIKEYSPNQVKLVLVDPKKVELAAYKNIPHLYKPVVTDPQEAANTLDELCEEMDRRYSIFEKVEVKNITSYNNLVTKYNESGKKADLMPYIIVIIDELADLMLVAKDQVEDSIQRLTQLARAAGIHLIVATQRPSVDVVTGVIKSNINSRIAFTTPSGVDSRTILDQNGAEKLLGKGDMLFKPLGATRVTRLQGAFVDDDEVADIVDEVNNQYAENDGTEQTVQQSDAEENKENAEDKEVDQNYERALEVARANKQLSASMLQLALHIPYSEASRLIQKMQDNGVIKQQEGSNRRRVNR